jgi:hypothetical protein
MKKSISKKIRLHTGLVLTSVFNCGQRTSSQAGSYIKNQTGVAGFILAEKTPEPMNPARGSQKIVFDDLKNLIVEKTTKIFYKHLNFFKK